MFNGVMKSAGRCEGAQSTAQFPVSYTYIYDISRRMKLKEGKMMKMEIIGFTDMWNSGKGTPTMFLREFQTAPELSLILANDKELDDVDRFGTGLLYKVLGVDPTFNIYCNVNSTISYILRSYNLHNDILVGEWGWV